jgi:hypothetical protein
MIDGDDSCRTAALGLKGVVAVPGADIEHASTRDRGEVKGRELLGEQLRRLVPTRDDTGAKIDRVPPFRHSGRAPFLQGVTIRLHRPAFCRKSRRSPRLMCPRGTVMERFGTVSSPGP